MTETGQMIFDTAERIFADSFGKEALRRAATGQWLAEEWATLEEAGLPLALVDEAAGGFGIEVADALGLVGLAARYAVPLPLVETMFANHLLAQAGLELGAGAVTIVLPKAADAIGLERLGEDRWRLVGQVSAVAWAEHVEGLVLAAGGRLVRLRKGAWAIVESGISINGHAVGRLAIDTVVTTADCAALPEGLGADVVLRGGAALRSIGIAGAIQRILAMTVDYLETRKQFGRPLARFQALQHEIAKMAAQGAAAAGAAGIAAEAFADRFAETRIALAKARAGEAASLVAGSAHQLHGAIGVTEEYDLHHLTRQLWAWRDEFGSEAFWNRRVGELALQSDADLWSFITAL